MYYTPCECTLEFFGTQFSASKIRKSISSMISYRCESDMALNKSLEIKFSVKYLKKWIKTFPKIYDAIGTT